MSKKNDSPAIEITIPSGGPNYLPGARLLAILAYPPTSARDHRWHTAERALCRHALHNRQLDNPQWADHEQWIVPAHMTMPLVDMRRELERVKRQHNDRLGAAHVAVPYFQEALSRQSGALPSRRRDITLDARIKRTNDQEADLEEWWTAQGANFKRRFPTDAHNFEHRVLRPSLPVLHLAVALAVMIDWSQKFLREQENVFAEPERIGPGGAQLLFGDMLTAPEFARAIVGNAIGYEDLLPHLPKPRIRGFVKLRLE